MREEPNYYIPQAMSNRILSRNEEMLLDFCKIPRTRDEVISFMGFSRYYTMSRIVKPLVEKGLLKMSLPDKPKSTQQRYYTE